MKKLIILVLILSAIFSACQPTPEEPVVRSKDKDLVAEVMEANKEENVTALDEDKEVIEQQIEAINKHLSMEFQANDRVKIVVDADVDIPVFDKISMVRAQPDNFSQEHLKKLIEEVCGENSVYFMGESHWSREEIEEILIVLRSYNQNSSLEPHIKSHLEGSIRSFERDLSSAVSKSREKLYDGTLTPVENNGRTSSLTTLKCYMGKAEAARIIMSQTFTKTNNQLQFDNESYGSGYSDFEPYEGVDADKIDISYDKCREIAETLVNELDGPDTNMTIFTSRIGYAIGHFTDYPKENVQQAYNFSFARQYGNVIVKPVNIFNTGNIVDYANRVSPEYISVTIDNDGICYFMWRSCTKYIETLSDDVPLMDFESVNGIFEDYCRYKFVWVPHGDLLSEDVTATININRVEMNFMMTPEKDSMDNFIMVPVWDYIGDINYDQEITAQDGYPYEGAKDVAVLTINAIDGTVINREQGY